MSSRLLLISALSLIGGVHAGWQVQCFSRLYDARVDPIVNPGAASSHVHVIAGGNGFAPSMDYNRAMSSTCQTCNIREDLSNYWTPKIYHKGADGKFKDVPIQGDDAYGTKGGMAIYYNDWRSQSEGNTVTAFPKDFRMLTGDNAKRTQDNSLESQAIMFECIEEGQKNVKFPGLPTKKCDAIVAEVVMPSCWDGVRTDSPDHKSHVSYPVGKIEGGNCPSTHPKRLMTMTYKVHYVTKGLAWNGNTQPFVIANGDNSGFSFHADFVNGWKIDVLQKAANGCAPDLTVSENKCNPSYTGSDRYFNFVKDQGEAFKCKLEPPIKETVTGIMRVLPGLDGSAPPAIQNPAAPGQAPAPSPAPAPAPVPAPSPSQTPSTNPAKPNGGGAIAVPADTPAVPSGNTDKSTDMSSKGFKYIGCAGDDPLSRTFKGSKWVGWPDMTISKCIDFCKADGYTYAGIEWGSECFCGKTLPAARAPTAASEAKCTKPCNGDRGQVCGGDKAMSLYQAAPVSRVRRHLAAHLGWKTAI